MSVYNGADALPDTLRSVLDQQDCDFEFIVVNDGSTDTSGQLLDEWARRDARLRVIHQANTGLTRALICGCADACGEFIARQDCGDVSLPGRLAQQVECLQCDAAAVAVSCHTKFIGPNDEPLYQTEISAARLNAGLNSCAEAVRGPSHHGSMMMRRTAYEATGGYRAAFYFAQDLDLWTRLVEQGRFAVVPQVLYLARLVPQAISGTQTLEQTALAKLVMAATQARRSGLSEEAYLTAASKIRPVKHGDLAQRVALGNYFIGSCLRKSNARAAAHYFRQAIVCDPWLWRARIRWIQMQLMGAWR
jgi:glycosyltransferase involved in cell wall biosynthesis